MMKLNKEEIIEKVKQCLITASCVFSDDKKEAYRKAVERETVSVPKWVLETCLQNAKIAEENRSPLCDDTGIPHLFLEIGHNQKFDAQLIEQINEGICEGLRTLPGRPMAINGDDYQRIDQSGGINSDPGVLMASPILVKPIDDEVIRLTILLLGGGPAIRGSTSSMYHQHSVNVVVDEIVERSCDAVAKLGCSPCTLAIGIGRSQFEASSLMIESMVYGRYDQQSDMEKEITLRVNKRRIGAMGLGGENSVLATFMKVGPQRASGVRIVCLHPCCCVEPRKASVLLIGEDGDDA
jgi:fumarate hydratase subunit alpha